MTENSSTETVIEASGLSKSDDSLNPFGRSIEVLTDAALRSALGLTGSQIPLPASLTTAVARRRITS
ncbi:hypothetical protein [Haloarcula pellucida]|uniref:hypothetical protein n=1 Tax=Haloarcula pellucida TaxID=1427151 RepID=UPI001667CD28|nr:hypothetical protein [Halomicroarcula pellucida]MBX0349259.1 hypothetical protein [Halomicroarcula pellucida]